MIAKKLVGQVGGGAHFANIVHTYQVCATQNAGGNRRRGGEFGLLGILVRQKMFARGTGQHRQIEPVQSPEPRENLRILFFALPKSK